MYLSQSDQVEVAVDDQLQGILDRLALPDDDRSFDRLFGIVESLYGKRLDISSISSPDQHHTGYWIDHDDYGVIMYRKADTATVRLHTLLHEFIHVVGGHSGCSARPEAADAIRNAGGDSIISIRGRSVTDGHLSDELQLEEVVAEQGAFALARWLRGAGSEAAADIF
jgi:hypothetical protein